MVSQGSVAMHLRCGGIFNDQFVIRSFFDESAGERILIIGQYLAKL